MPRNGVPEMGTDLPLAAVDVAVDEDRVDVPAPTPSLASGANLFFGGLAFGMGSAGWAKQLLLIAAVRVIERRSA